MGNIISFHGSDSKSGVTMTAVSVCQQLAAGQPDRKVIYIGANEGGRCQYLREDACSIGDIKLHLENRTLKAEEIQMMCKYSDNFYVLSAEGNPVNQHEFFPETSQYLLGVIRDYFDYIVCDTGNSLDDGLALGALQSSDWIYYVMAQQESSIRGYEKNSWIYRKLDIGFEKIILNRFFVNDPYDVRYVAKRTGRTEDLFFPLRMAGYARQAEMERKTLMQYRNDMYRNDIGKLAEYITVQAGFRMNLEKKRKLWRIGSI